MHYTFKTKNTTVTDALKSKITEKLSRLERLLPEDTDVTVSLAVIKSTQKIEVTIKLPKRILRAEVSSNDMYNAIDEVTSKLEKQLTKYKGRLKDKVRKDVSFIKELEFFENTNDDISLEEIKIDKVKNFSIQLMDAEEAVMQMELVSHNFFIFKNIETSKINVVYKRLDQSYGLIEIDN